MAESTDTIALQATDDALPRSSLTAPLRVRNFRNLWLGQSISLVGDQFKFVALSWLVLSLTGRNFLRLGWLDHGVRRRADVVCARRSHDRSLRPRGPHRARAPRAGLITKRRFVTTDLTTLGVPQLVAGGS